MQDANLCMPLWLGVTDELALLTLYMTSLPYANEGLWKVGLPMQNASLCMPLWLGVTDELALLLYVVRRLMRA